MNATPRKPGWAHGSLQRRMLLAVSLPFVAVVVLTFVTFLVRQQALDTRDDGVQALRNDLALEQLRSASQEAHVSALLYSRTENGTWLTTYGAAVATRNDLRQQLALVLDPEAADRVDAAVEDHQEALRALLVGAGRDRGREQLEDEATEDEQRLATVVGDVARLQDERFRSLQREADWLDAGITKAGALIVVIGVGGGLTAVWFLSRGVTSRLRRLQVNAQRLGTGETLLPETGDDDEIGELAGSIEAAHAAIREKDDLLDLALEAGSMLIFELRADERITLRGEPALLGTVGLEGPAATTTLSALQQHVEPGADDAGLRIGDGDLQVRTLDGRTRWLEVRSREQPAAEHEEAGRTVGVVTDVTARVEAQAALHSAKEQAEAASRFKDDFLSRMSHELRTPLNAVLGFAQLLGMDELDAEQQESVEHILKGGRHLLALVNDVLDLARIESGRLSLSVEPTRLAEVVDEAVQLTLPLARQHGIEIGVAGDDTVHAMVDRRRMKQVLLNLVSNGIKYNRPGGRVDVGWSVDGKATLTVTDTGIGISDQQRGDLFLPFARSDARTADIEGTGLGLAVSRSLVEAMGGALTLTATGDTGSTFAVELPRAVDGVPELVCDDPAETAVEQLRALGPRSVLHVEDNAANRRLVEELLRRAGSPPPIATASGREALELARELRPDLVLLDRHLPDMLGEQVLRALRADLTTASIPVVVVSADAMARSVSVLRRSGADAFVAKPIEAEEFWRTVRSVLVQREGVS